MNAETGSIPAVSPERPPAAEPEHPRPVAVGERGDGSWKPLTRSERSAVVLFVLVLAVSTVPFLPPGICYSDGGDLQLAAATLGVMHPPGYAGYVSLLHLLTQVPGVDPAYMVSLGCLAAGITALMLLVLIMIRLGVDAWWAAALALGLATWRMARLWIWVNLVAPEVYGLSLALLLGVIYLLMRHHARGKTRDLFVAALLYGFLVANRPVAIYFLPFVVIAWWAASRRHRLTPARAVGRLGVCALLASLPGFYTLGYLWVRDNPSTPYVYIDHHNAEFRHLPESTDGPAAKWERILWHVTAQEFHQYIRTEPKRMWNRLRWVYKLFFLYQPVRFALTMTLLLGGAALVWVRFRQAFALLIGAAVADLVFICTYDIHGQAGDISPLLAVCTVLFGVVTSVLFPRQAGVVRRLGAVSLMLAVSISMLWRAPALGPRSSEDALQWVRDVDMKTLPANAVICSTWRESPALWYAKHVLTGRKDVSIINTVTFQWIERVKQLPGRPVFSVAKVPEVTHYDPQPYRVVRAGDSEFIVLWKLGAFGPGKTPPDDASP